MPNYRPLPSHRSRGWHLSFNAGFEQDGRHADTVRPSRSLYIRALSRKLTPDCKIGSKVGCYSNRRYHLHWGVVVTTLVAWVSYQNSVPASLNIASDSRFTWGTEAVRWDCGRKIFWSKNGREVFGYAGDVVSQSNMLSQLCELIDYSTVVIDESDAQKRHDVYFELLRSTFAAQVDVPRQNMMVFHGTRQEPSSNMQGDSLSTAAQTNPFRLWTISYDPVADVWKNEEHRFPDEVDDRRIDKTIFPNLALAAGSGAGIFRSERDSNFKKYGYRSRAVFAALMHAIGERGDAQSGGPAQAVTLGLTGAAKPVGFYIDGYRSVAGMRLGEVGTGGAIEWRNSDFDFLRGSDLKIASGARKGFYW